MHMHREFKSLPKPEELNQFEYVESKVDITDFSMAKLSSESTVTFSLRESTGLSTDKPPRIARSVSKPSESPLMFTNSVSLNPE